MRLGTTWFVGGGAVLFVRVIPARIESIAVGEGLDATTIPFNRNQFVV